MDVELITKMVIDAIKSQKHVDRFDFVKADNNVPVGVSGRHIHLSAEHVQQLFGVGYQLSKKKELMGGQYACEECITIVGNNLKAIENVRILGPERKQTQVEVSATDAVKLGIAAPIRESGDLADSAPITIVGPKGVVYLKEGCIIAARHIHMPTGMGFKDGEIVSVEVGGQRGLRFENVKIRVDAFFTLEMHIDTDEANACGIKTGDFARL